MWRVLIIVLSFSLTGCFGPSVIKADTIAFDDVSLPPLIYPYWHQGLYARDRLSDVDRLIHAGRDPNERVR